MEPPAFPRRALDRRARNANSEGRNSSVSELKKICRKLTRIVTLVLRLFHKSNVSVGDIRRFPSGGCRFCEPCTCLATIMTIERRDRDGSARLSPSTIANVTMRKIDDTYERTTAVSRAFGVGQREICVVVDDNDGNACGTIDRRSIGFADLVSTRSAFRSDRTRDNTVKH